MDAVEGMGPPLLDRYPARQRIGELFRGTRAVRAAGCVSWRRDTGGGGAARRGLAGGRFVVPVHVDVAAAP